jgi:ATP-dependent RNA helicase DHX36
MVVWKSFIAAFVVGGSGGARFLARSSRQITYMSQSNSTSSSGRGGRNSSNAARGRGRGRGRGPSHGGRGTGQARTNGGRGTGRAPPSNMGGRAPFAGVGRAGPIRGTGPAVATAGRAHSRVSTAKSNGDKGAEIHTVSESDRINLTRVLMTLRESDQTSATFSPQLTNTERKFVHSLAAQLGLVSKSNGKGENRCITVTKRAEKKKKTGVADEQEETYPMLQVGARGIAALKHHIHNHPPTEAERKESFETGSSLMGDTNDASLNETLAGMGFGSHHMIADQVRSRPINIDLARRARQHASAQNTKVTHPAYRRMQDQRRKLPAWSYMDAICQVVAANSVTVLSGETGCGKSTQVPQFLLDNDPTANIVVTQPRRISAIAVAERVASEQCLEPIGGMVGYQVRLESAMSSSTQLLFLTPGVLLRKLQSSPMLMEFTYIIIDEIHERDKYTEFLLIALKEILPSRPDLRIVLMSATLQIQTLIDYWYDVGGVGPPGQISIPGRTFPVQEFFLEDILTMTKYLDEKEVDSTDQLEAAMAMLLAKKNPHHQLAPKKNSQKKQHPTAISQVEMDEPLTLPSDRPSFSCVMCNRSGFSSPDELGEHIAFCDGGVGESMAELEDRVRNIAVGQTNGAAVATSSNRGLEDTMLEDYDASDDDDDSESDASKTKKWDGEGVFEMSDPSTEPVTTEEEEKLLTQYQAVHNDEKIDDALLLEVIQLIVASSNGNGAILVFFPGWGEISEFLMLLESTPPFYNRNKYLILPLHSGIPSYDQRKVFDKPPKGVRKIILSTNIAETSVTIDDVSFVVDTGRAKEKSYDPHLKTSTLAPTWISQASAKQRKGRAGRTKRGVAFRLFSKRRYESFRPFVESELLRTPLVRIVHFCSNVMVSLVSLITVSYF